MKSLQTYITEASNRTPSLKWGEKEWTVIEKMVDHVHTNPVHAEWYKKMEKDKSNTKYEFDIFGTSSPVLNQLNSWQHIQKNNGKKFGYWTPDSCSEFTITICKCIYYALQSEMAFHESDPSKDDYTDADIKVMHDMSEKIESLLPTGKMLTKSEIEEIIKPIITKHNATIEKGESDWDFVCVQCEEDYRSFNAVSDEIEKALSKNQNTVTGDGQMYSIYIKF